MAKKMPTGLYSFSADQLVESASTQDILNTTLSIDIALGGGIPYGSTVLLGGRPKAGKSTLALSYAADGQNRFNSKVFYFDVEGRLKPHIFKQIPGIKTDKESLEVLQNPPTLDDKGNPLGHAKQSAEIWWEDIGKTIQNHPRSIMIVDSIASLSSDKEISEGTGYQGRGMEQKLQAQFCRQYGDLIGANGIVLFLLTQIQANTSGYGESMQMKVGNAIKHQADTIIFAKGIRKWEKEGDGKVYGHDINCYIEHSAIGYPHTSVDVPLRYGEGFDVIKDLVTYGQQTGLIKTAASWIYLPYKESENGELSFVEDVTKECVKVHGAESARNWLSVRPEQRKELTSKLSERLML